MGLILINNKVRERKRGNNCDLTDYQSDEAISLGEVGDGELMI
jgi:hypothetical protein